MIKSNRGVSLVTLVITIVVMFIMISITISASIKSVEETNTTKIDHEIRSLRDAVSDRLANNKRNAVLYPIIGEKIGDSVNEYIRSIENLEGPQKEKIINKINNDERNFEETKDFFRLVGRTEAEKLGVENIDVEHFYVVDYYECEVYGPINPEILNP